MKRAPTSASSPRSFIRCVQNYFWAYGTFDANRASILCQDYLQTDWIERTLEPHHLGEQSRVCPKWVLSLWYVWRKACTYLVLTLALSPNGLNRACSWASSPRSTSGCVQNDFLSLWYVLHKPCTYLALTLTLSPNRPKRDSIWPTSPRSSIGCIQNDIWICSTFDANHASILRQE
jgi:hypothetical protein